jgi:lincosamide nucleotidyltransferase A/C/D/E
MSAQDAVRLVRLFQDDGIEVWLDGGWGVDALLGEETREHDDLDLVCKLADSDRIVELLEADGYELVDGRAPLSFVLVDADGRQVDVHPVVLDEARGGVYQMKGGREWIYPAEGFAGRGRVAGQQVRCLTPEVQVLVHDGYELGEKDYRELRLLHDRFGVDLPEAIAARVLSIDLEPS